MPFKSIRTFAVSGAFALLAQQPLHAADGPVAGDDPGQVDYAVLFDPEAASADRELQEARLLERAEAGDHASRCLLGRIHFRQAVRASGLDSAQADRAAHWLNACILGGDINAMLVMAELELAQERPLEAAIWVQGFLKLAQVLGNEVANDAAAYRAALLARIDRKAGGRRADNTVLLEYVAGFLANYGERILGACRAGGCNPWPELPGAQSLRMVGSGDSYGGRMHRDIARLEDNSYATFLVEVDASGATRRAMLVESYPDNRAARKLSGWARTRKYAPAAGEDTRYRFIHGYLDNGMLELDVDAHARSRGRM